MRRAAAAGILGVTVMIGAGCTGGGSTQISGKVKLDGSPLPDAELLFEKRDKDGVGKFDAKTDSEGKFQVPHIPGRVIPPGTYQVMITKWVDKKGKVTAPEEIEQLRAAGNAKNIVPEKYGDPASSPLKAEIKEGTTEVPLFDLTSKGK